MDSFYTLKRSVCLFGSISINRNDLSNIVNKKLLPIIFKRIDNILIPKQI